MPKIILMRSDDDDKIKPLNFTKYSRTPAEHLNLDGQQNWKNSGYVSTFAYDLTRGDVDSEPYRPLFLKSMGEGESGRGDYIHFIILDTDSYGGELIKLNGGTHGIEQITQEDAREAAKDFGQIQGKVLRLGGTVWEIPNFDKDYPQVFNTEGVSVELGSGRYRTDYEVLLGGNWQKYAVTKTITREEFKNFFSGKYYNGKNDNNFPTVDKLADDLINNRIQSAVTRDAQSPKGESPQQVAHYTQEAKQHFDNLKEQAERARQYAEQVRQREIQEKLKKEAEEKIRREAQEREAQEWWQTKEEPEQQNIILQATNYLTKHFPRDRYTVESVSQSSRSFIKTFYEANIRDIKREIEQQEIASAQENALKETRLLKDKMATYLVSKDMGKSEIIEAKRHCKPYMSITRLENDIKEDPPSKEYIEARLKQAKDIAEEFMQNSTKYIKERPEKRKSPEKSSVIDKKTLINTIKDFKQTLLDNGYKQDSKAYGDIRIFDRKAQEAFNRGDYGKVSSTLEKAKEYVERTINSKRTKYDTEKLPQTDHAEITNDQINRPNPFSRFGQ